jgi:hypothetical protein
MVPYVSPADGNDAETHRWTSGRGDQRNAAGATGGGAADKCTVGTWFRHELQTLGGIGGRHEGFQPLFVEGWNPACRVLEVEGYAEVNPDRAPTVAGLWVVLSGEVERLLHADLLADHHLEMRQQAVLELNGVGGVVRQPAHGGSRPRRLTLRPHSLDRWELVHGILCLPKAC